MNCFDCAALGISTAAVGMCSNCGAGLCVDHVRVEAQWLTRTAVINRTIVVEPPARVIRCPVCQAAHDAATNGSARTAIAARSIPTTPDRQLVTRPIRQRKTRAHTLRAHVH